MVESKCLNRKLIVQIIKTIFQKKSSILIGFWVCLELVRDFTSASICAYVIIISV